MEKRIFQVLKKCVFLFREIFGNNGSDLDFFFYFHLNEQIIDHVVNLDTFHEFQTQLAGSCIALITNWAEEAFSPVSHFENIGPSGF